MSTAGRRTRRGCGNVAKEVRIESLDRRIAFHDAHILKASTELISTIQYHEVCRAKLEEQRTALLQKLANDKSDEWYETAKRLISESGKTIQEVLEKFGIQGPP